MAKDPSFDVVSEMNMEEVKNSVQMTVKELTNRFDFKGSTVDIKLENQKLIVLGDDDFKLEQNILNSSVIISYGTGLFVDIVVFVCLKEVLYLYFISDKLLFLE